MKSYKHTAAGFTLVEMIVVIAIIGVLAAIMLPSMIGYINRARFSGINSSAKTLYNAGMTACRETEVERPITEGIYTKNSAPDGYDATMLRKFIYEYFSSAQTAEWAILIEGDVVTATCITKSTDDVYVGTYPRKNDKKMAVSSANDYQKFLNYAKTGSWDVNQVHNVQIIGFKFV